MATDYSIACLARGGDAGFLAGALMDARRRTLGLLDACVARLGPELAVPYSPQLNPPRWEVGHVAWFHDLWIARNPQRHLGVHADPDCPRPAGRLAGADALYNSSQVKHETRWGLPLPDLAATRRYMEESLAETLALLARDAAAGRDLYFYRLALFHEDMHAEAATYMAQALDIALPAQLRPWQRPLPAVRELAVAPTTWRLGYEMAPCGADFAFDNELLAHDLRLRDFAIDSVPVSWRRFLPAVEAGAVGPPRYLRRQAGRWQARRFGTWEALEPDAAAVHLTRDEAQAWCAWAGRRLPTEAEWECAAMTQPGFEWGEVWEWTASRFAPFEGFVAHPYRDYSRFGFEEQRYVLKGASRATDPRMAHPKYRNYFTSERNDIHMGFRSCAV